MRRAGVIGIAAACLLATVGVGVASFVFGDNVGQDVSGSATVQVGGADYIVDPYGVDFPESFAYVEGTASSSSYTDSDVLTTVSSLGFTDSIYISSEYQSAFFVEARFEYSPQDMLDFREDMAEHADFLLMNISLAVNDTDSFSSLVDASSARLFLVYDGTVRAAHGEAMTLDIASVQDEGYSFQNYPYETSSEGLSYEEFFTIGNGYGTQTLEMIFAFPVRDEASFSEDTVSSLSFSIGYGFHYYYYYYYTDETGE